MVELLYPAGAHHSARIIASEDIPRYMNAVVALGREGGDKKGKPLGYRFATDHLTPMISDGEALLKVEYSGICHTDLLCLDGVLVVGKERIPGHEFAGEIVAVGHGVNPKQLGRKRVALALFGGKGMQPNLNNATFTGTEAGVDGGFANYFAIKPEYLVSIPRRVSTKQAFAAGDALMTSRHAVSKIIRKYVEAGRPLLYYGFDCEGPIALDDGRKGDILGRGKKRTYPKIAVYGATGGLGIATINNLLAFDIINKNIYAVDVRPEFLEILRRKLRVNTINSEGKPVADKIKEMAGGPVDAAIDCFGSGGSLKQVYNSLEGLTRVGVGEGETQFNFGTFRDAMNQLLRNGTINDARNAVRKGGDIQVIGARGDHVLIPTGSFMENEVDWSGPWGGTEADAKMVLEDIKRGYIPGKGLELLLGEELPFTAEGFAQGVKNLRDSAVMGRIYFKMQ